MNVTKALVIALFALSLTLGVAVARPVPTHPITNPCTGSGCWG